MKESTTSAIEYIGAFALLTMLGSGVVLALAPPAVGRAMVRGLLLLLGEA